MTHHTSSHREDSDREPATTPTLTNLRDLVYEATRTDVKLAPQEVEAIWHDEFLTNVIVPFLDHIARYVRMAKSTNEGVRRRWEDIDTYNMKADIFALERTIWLLKEWRG